MTQMASKLARHLCHAVLRPSKQLIFQAFRIGAGDLFPLGAAENPKAVAIEVHCQPALPAFHIFGVPAGDFLPGGAIIEPDSMGTEIHCETSRPAFESLGIPLQPWQSPEPRISRIL